MKPGDLDLSFLSQGLAEFQRQVGESLLPAFEDFSRGLLGTSIAMGRVYQDLAQMGQERERRRVQEQYAALLGGHVEHIQLYGYDQPVIVTRHFPPMILDNLRVQIPRTERVTTMTRNQTPGEVPDLDRARFRDLVSAMLPRRQDAQTAAADLGAEGEPEVEEGHTFGEALRELAQAMDRGEIRFPDPERAPWASARWGDVTQVSRAQTGTEENEPEPLARENLFDPTYAARVWGQTRPPAQDALHYIRGHLSTPPPEGWANVADPPYERQEVERARIVCAGNYQEYDRFLRHYGINPHAGNAPLYCSPHTTAEQVIRSYHVQPDEIVYTGTYGRLSRARVESVDPEASWDWAEARIVTRWDELKDHARHLLCENHDMPDVDFLAFWNRAMARWNSGKSYIINLEAYLQSEVSVQECALAGHDPLTVYDHKTVYGYEEIIAVMNDTEIDVIPQAKAVADAMRATREWVQ